MEGRALGPEATRPRRGRPPSIDDERLLDVAREVFLEKGVRATTAEVAERAAISQGTIFHRFGTKEALFRKALRYDPSTEPAFLTTLAARAGEGSLPDVLIEIGLELLERGSIALPLMMMEWSNPTGRATLDRLAGGNEARITRAVGALRGFFEEERRNGRIAEGVSPDVVSRMFAGSLHQFCLQEMLSGARTTRATRRKFVRGIVDVLLTGIAGSSRSLAAPSSKVVADDASATTATSDASKQGGRRSAARSDS